MAISMAKTIKEERLRWVKPIAEKRVKLVNVSKVCPHSKRSLERWVAVYKRGGEKALEPKATIPKTSPEETPIWIKERVITKRKKTKLCALKLHWRLAKEGLVVPVRTIGKILKSRRSRLRKYQSTKKGEVQVYSSTRRQARRDSLRSMLNMCRDWLQTGGITSIPP